MANPIVMARRTIVGDLVQTRHYFWCPGCNTLHGIAILPDRQENGAGWTFTGTLENPTYSPSLLSQWNGKTPMRCHSFIENGHFRYLSDCTHALKDQVVPIPPLPDWMVRDAEEEI